MRKPVLAALALGAASLAITACSEAPEPAQEEAAPDGYPGISVKDGRLILPAVSGNPGAVYFTLSYEGDKNPMIRAVFVDGAESAMMHMTEVAQGKTYMNEVPQLPVVAGEDLVFEPGARHVMAMGLSDTLQAGDTTEVTLTFVGGDKFSFPVEVRAAGAER